MSAQSNRLLVVSWTVPPALTGSSIIVDNLSRQFSADELVLTGELPVGDPPTPRAAYLPAIHYVRRQRDWPRRGQRWFRWFGFRSLVKRLEVIAKRQDCDSVLGVFPDEFYLLAAYQAAQRLDLKFYVYFHNTWAENRTGLLKHIARRWQPRVFQSAEKIFVISDGLQSHYQKLDPDTPLATLPHTWRFAPEVPSFHPTKGQIRIALLGNVNESNADAARRLTSIINASNDLKLTVFTGQTQQHLSGYGIAGPGVSVRRLSPDEVPRELRQFNVLYLPHGFTGGRSRLEYDTIFPTRTIDYLTAGRPILAHCPESSFLATWLRRNQCADLVTNANAEAVTKALRELAADVGRQTELVNAGIAAAQQFEPARVANKLRDALGLDHRQPSSTDSSAHEDASSDDNHSKVSTVEAT